MNEGHGQSGQLEGIFLSIDTSKHEDNLLTNNQAFSLAE